MALAAVDPWVVAFTGHDGDDDLRWEALEGFTEVVDSHPDLETLRFVDASFYEGIGEMLDRMAEEDPEAAPPIQNWYGRLRSIWCARNDIPHEFGVQGRWWIEVAVALREDDTPHWRNPVFFVPQCREHLWPRTELEIVHRDLRRLVVVIEAPEENALFARDFDPWQCERVRSSGRDMVERDLPRPAATNEAPMAAWRGLLENHSDSVSAASERLEFLPPKDWKACDIVKRQWRDCPFGSHARKQVRGSTKTGPVDRRGRIWNWDEAHLTHWDVQHERAGDRRYMNVRPDGVITRHYDDADR